MEICSSLLRLVFCFVLVHQWPLSKAAMTCTNEKGETVDWFVVYKLPKLLTPDNSLISKGTAYLYWTSDMGSSTDHWTLSTVSIDSAVSLPGLTLSQIYSRTNLSEVLTVLYNDEFPNGTTTFNLGHTKGILAADESAGFWMSHSVPRFPYSPLETRNYSYPSTATVFGQTMLCITLQTPQMDLIGSQMKFMAPFVYFWNIPEFVEKTVPNLVEAVNGMRVKQPPYYMNRPLKSAKGFAFQSFAKAKQFGKDLYADWLAPSLATSLAVETWQNGEGKVMASDCSQTFTTENVKALNLTSTYFTSHKDHSKWAIALNRNTPWICIGDINRMESQKKRGGGSVCFLHEALWQKFHQSAAILEPCPIANPKSSASTTYPMALIFLLIFWFTLKSDLPLLE